MTASRRGNLLPLAAALFIALVALILCSRPLARGDGLVYFMWLDSIAGDADLDLSNQAQIFAHLNTYQVRWNERTGQWVTVFPYGSALLLTPAYWLGHLANRLGWLSVNSDYFIGLQGRPLAYSLFPMFAVNLYALGTVALAYLCARRYAPSFPAATSALFLFLGTPMLYYATIEPFTSHVPGAFLTALTLYLMLRWEGNPHPLLAVAAGLAGGLATLSRWQMALTVWPLALLFLRRQAWGALALFTTGFCAVVWHLLYTWNWMFGRPLLLAHAESGFLGWPRYIIPVLFSGGRGLFVWAPLTTLALIGLIPLGRQDRILAIGLGISFLLQTLINASVADWWAGWGFGMRRMTELYPVFVVGLAALLAWARPSWLRSGVWALSVAGLILSVLLFLSHLNFVNTVLDRPQGDAAWVELRYQLVQSNFRITWQVFREHYGPWAWSRPGP